jgi:hypothetical protein
VSGTVKIGVCPHRADIRTALGRREQPDWSTQTLSG